MQCAASKMLFDLNSILLINNKTSSVYGVACGISGSHNLASVGICGASSQFLALLFGGGAMVPLP